MDNYRKLKEAGIGTYILFQETYNKQSYEQLHPNGPKSNYAYHTEAMDRAMEGGIDDVGCGVLFGLNMYRYDFVGLLMHAEHLEAVHGVGPHTISVPRICPADDINPDELSLLENHRKQEKRFLTSVFHRYPVLLPPVSAAMQYRKRKRKTVHSLM